MNTERATFHAETLAEYRQNRHAIRAVLIISDCCPTCDLDSNREFSLDAVPILPHAFCTNPDGCRCVYAAVPISAPPAPETDAPSLYPPRTVAASQVGIPAYLKTPAAAMILFGVAVLSCVTALINSTSGTRTTAAAPSAGSAARITLPVQTSRTVQRPALVIPVSTIRVERPRDKDVEAKATRDLQEAEANARANETARRAQEVAVQQQTYLRNLLSRQSQVLPGTRVSSHSARPDSTVAAASTSAASDEQQVQ